MVLGWSCLPFGPNRARGSTHFHRHSHPYRSQTLSTFIQLVSSDFRFFSVSIFGAFRYGLKGCRRPWGSYLFGCSVHAPVRVWAGLPVCVVAVRLAVLGVAPRVGEFVSPCGCFLVRGLLGYGTELLCGPNIGSSAIWYLIFSASGS